MGTALTATGIDLSAARRTSRTILHSAAAFLFASIINSAALFLLSVCIARYLGRGGLGLYTVAIYGTMIGALIADMGIDSFVVRAFASGPQAPEIPFAIVFRTKILFSSIIAVTAAGAIGLVQNRLDLPLTIAAMLILPRSVCGILESYLKATQQRGTLVMFTCLSAALTTSLVLVALQRGFGLPWLLGCILCVECFKGIALMVNVRKHLATIRAPLHDISAGLRKLLPATVPFALIGVISYVTSRIDVFLLASLRGAQEAGMYAAADRFMITGNLVAFALYGSTLPVFSSIRDVHQRHYVIGRSLRFAALYSSVAAVLLFLLAPLLITVTFRFHESIGILRILAFSIPCIIVNAVLGTALFALRQERSIAFVLAAACVLNIALNVLFIPRFGSTGSATISVLTEYGFTIIYAALYLRKTRLV